MQRLIFALFVCSHSLYISLLTESASAADGLRSQAEAELHIKAPKLTADAKKKSLATVRVDLPKEDGDPQAAWQLGIDWQSLQASGQSSVQGLNNYDLSHLAPAPMWHVEISKGLLTPSRSLPGHIRSFFSAAYSATKARIHTPTGLTLDDTRFIHMLGSAGLHWSHPTATWGLPWRWGFRASVGHLTQTQTGSSAHVRLTRSGFVGALAPTIEIHLSPSWLLHGRWEFRQMLSHQESIQIQASNALLGLRYRLSE